jgi:predicted nucleotidyltransferase
MAVVSIGDFPMIQRIMAILKLWAKTLESKIGTDGVYVFGSLIYRDGQQFGDQSDIDLVVRFPYSAITALDRLYWLESLHAEKRKLEAQLSGVLKRNPETHICSMVVPTAIELYADLHKDGQTDSFFSGNQFFDLLMEVKTVGIAKARDYPIADPLVVQGLRFAQKKRNQYLGVSASGVTSFSSFDGEDPIPKEFMRHAAIASSVFMPGSEAGAAYDVQFGLDFISNGLYRIRNTDRYIEGLHDRLSIRRKARPARGQVITPQDQLFLAEWIFDQALEALCLKDYARERLPERTCRDLIERVSADLQQRGWSVANLEMGQGCTNPSLNTLGSKVTRRPTDFNPSTSDGSRMCITRINHSTCSRSRWLRRGRTGETFLMAERSDSHATSRSLAKARLSYRKPTISAH